MDDKIFLDQIAHAPFLQTDEAERAIRIMAAKILELEKRVEEKHIIVPTPGS